MTVISDLPMPHDIEADYPPRHIKLTRILGSETESGRYRRAASSQPPTSLAYTRWRSESPAVRSRRTSTAAASRPSPLAE